MDKISDKEKLDILWCEYQGLVLLNNKIFFQYQEFRKKPLFWRIFHTPSDIAVDDFSEGSNLDE